MNPRLLLTGGLVIVHMLLCQAGRADVPSSLPASRPAAADPQKSWRPVGISGGGGMYGLAISPLDPKLMMVHCDMSGAYLTADAGGTWRMVHYSQLRSSTRASGAFHPADPKVMFSPQAGQGLKVSRDGGLTWQRVAGTPDNLTGRVEIDPSRPDRMLIGDAKGAWLSLDAGKTWSQCRGPAGRAIGFHFDQTSDADARVCFAATADGIWRSQDSGKTWKDATSGLPNKKIMGFCGGSNAKSKQSLLYCSVTASQKDDRYVGGVYRSADGGQTWESVMNGDINMDIAAADKWAHGSVAQYHIVLTSDANPDVVYALNSNTGVNPPHHTAAFRSADAGKTWKPTFYPDPRFKQCNLEPGYVATADGQYYQGVPNGAALDPNDPNRLAISRTDIVMTTDGGKTYRSIHTRRAKADGDGQPAWECNGLVLTSSWHYYVDPFKADRHYIAYTDIGLVRSADAGKTWIYWPLKGRPPWRNTCYELAFDPDVEGRIWGAFSDVHDIPNGNIIKGNHRGQGGGGVCVSTDFGATWAVSGKGLPVFATTSVVLDPRTPKGKRTLYAAVYDHGVYKSIDDGESWVKASDGLANDAHMKVCRVQLHPDGTLFAMVTGLRGADGKFVTNGPGLYRSADAGKSWQHITQSQPLHWPKDFTVDPADSRIIYIGAADAGSDKRQGGLWRTLDAGKTWTLLAREGPEHFGAYLHPRKPGWIYMTLAESAPGSGLWLSKDNGKSFKAVDGLPFANAQRVVFPVKDDSTIRVTTFGGSVWIGPED